jgi:hypothetical protein
MNAPISVATLQRINAGQPRRLRFTAENTLDFNGRTLERFTLSFMEIIARHGSGFAFPSQTVYLARDSAPRG